MSEIRAQPLPETLTSGPEPARGNVVALPLERRGDPLQQLLARFGTRLRHLVDQHCRSDQGLDADDIEQEVRIKLWKALQRDPNAALPASYIQRVVVSTVIDGLRRRQARPSEPLPETEEELVGADLPDQGPLDAAAGSEHTELLRRALARLADRRRLPVELHLQGFSQQEVAELAGLSLDSSRKLVERGLKDLRAALAELGLSGIND